MVRFEKDCGGSFDAVIAVSAQDKLLFESNYGWQHVHAIDTAVDEEYFRNDGSLEVPDRVTFLGSMDWMPNQDGVKWFAKEVWPMIRAIGRQQPFTWSAGIRRRIFVSYRRCPALTLSAAFRMFVRTWLRQQYSSFPCSLAEALASRSMRRWRRAGPW